MDAIIFNPTNETMRPLCGGYEYLLKPGQKKGVPQSVANHIINEYQRRGITLLSYGDDTVPSEGNPEQTVEDYKAEQGRKRNMTFKREQVVRLNQLNEARKQEGKKFISPTEQVTAYSEELGLQLISPYDAPDLKNMELASLKNENDDLKKTMEEQTAKMDRLMDALEGKLAPEKVEQTPDEARNSELASQFFGLKKSELKIWVKENESEILAWPEEVRSRLRTKYARFYGKNLKI
jgi:hypothetical protein